MRLPRTLSLYLVREVALFTAFGLAALTPLLVSRNLIELLEDLAAAELGFAEVAELARCVTAMLVAYALPIAFLLGVLLAVGRLAADREVTALRACGLGTRHVLAPVVALGLLVSCLTGYLMLEVEHRAQRELRARVRLLATHGTMLEPGAFRRMGERVVFVRERDASGAFSGILISDRSNPDQPLLIAAERGELAVDAGEWVRLRLSRGDVQVGGGETSRIAFEHFDYALPAAELFGPNLARLRPREMSMDELLEIARRGSTGDPLSEYRKRNPAEYWLQIHRRIALPFAPALFALVGVPLALQVRRNARGWGTLACAVLVGGYYLLLSFGQFLALDGTLPAALAVWAPNAAFAAVGLALLLASRRPGLLAGA